jgi:hypothetical protein
MTRKLKMLGMAFVAVLALTAVSASAASAASYTASSYPTTGTGVSAIGNDTFTTEAGTVECASHFEGTLATEAKEELTVKAKYSNCKAFGFLNATVAMGSCDYLFETPSGSGSSWTATVDVDCTSSEIITITAGTCKVTIGAQSPGGNVSITNNAGGDVSVDAGVTGIAYTVTQDGFGCPFAGTGAKTGATYTQHSAVTFDAANNIHVG